MLLLLLLALTLPQLAAPALSRRWPALAFVTPPLKLRPRARYACRGGGEYVRLIERSDGFDLATARISLVSERNATLTLAATIHLGERRYFEQLQVSGEPCVL